MIHPQTWAQIEPPIYLSALNIWRFKSGDLHILQDKIQAELPPRKPIGLQDTWVVIHINKWSGHVSAYVLQIEFDVQVTESRNISWLFFSV